MQSSLLYGAYALGDSDHLEYVPNIFMELEKPMTLSQRVFNVFNIKILDYFFFQRPKPEIQSIVEKLIPGCPPIDVIENDVSLCLTNSHPIFHYPRTMTPEMIEIGGIHCRPANSLSPVRILSLCHFVQIRLMIAIIGIVRFYYLTFFSLQLDRLLKSMSMIMKQDS